MWDLEDEATQEVLKNTLYKYQYALEYIGINFEDEDIIEALENCFTGLEASLQATISYWMWKKKNNLDFEHPNAFFIKALNEKWTPIEWHESYMNNPNFKSKGTKWSEKTIQTLGNQKTQYWIADVSFNEYGREYITFFSGRKLPVNVAIEMELDQILEKYY